MKIPLVDGLPATSAEFSASTLFIGTSAGAVHSYAVHKYLNDSTHAQAANSPAASKKKRIVRQIALFPSLERLLTVYEPPATSGFHLKTLQPTSGFSMRDVSLVIQDPFRSTIDPSLPPTKEQAVVVTSKAIRVLDVTSDSVGLRKTIDYPGILTACGTGELLLIATSAAYELVDIAKESKVPLFPTPPTLPPHVDVVSHNEFLVVQGMARNEESMGLVISDQGEITRHGQIIRWHAYPDSVCVVGDYVLAVIGDELVVHHLGEEIEEVQRKVLGLIPEEESIDEVRDAVKDEVKDEVKEEVKDEVKEEVNDEVKDANLQSTDPPEDPKPSDEEPRKEVVQQESIEVVTEPATVSTPKKNVEPVKLQETGDKNFATPTSSVKRKGRGVAPPMALILGASTPTSSVSMGSMSSSGLEFEREEVSDDPLGASILETTHSASKNELSLASPDTAPAKVSEDPANDVANEQMSQPEQLVDTETSGPIMPEEISDPVADSAQSAEEPIQPITDQPIESVSEEPAQPISEGPAQSVGTEPVQPAIEVTNPDSEVSLVVDTQEPVSALLVPSNAASENPSPRTSIDLEVTESESKPYIKIIRTHDAYEIVDSDLMSKLGIEHASTVESQVLILAPDHSLCWWAPPAPFLALEKRILEDEITEITPELTSPGTERGVVELEYLSLLLAVHLLESGNYVDAVKAWLDGIILDPLIVLYIFGHYDQLPETVFPGLVAQVDGLRTRDKGRPDMQFYKAYLRAQLRRQRVSNAELALSIERIYSKLLSEKELVAFITDSATLSKELLIEDLLEQQKYGLLEEIYSRPGYENKLLDLWRNFLTGTWASPVSDQSVYSTKIADYLIQSDDQELVWRLALDLVSLDPQNGVRVFTNPNVQTKFDEKEVFETLRRQDGDIAWRAYLKYLVYEAKKPVYIADLSTLVVNDLIELLKEKEVAESLADSYETYRKLGWPKRPYYQYLYSWQKSHGQNSSKYARLVELQFEFYRLIKHPESDVMSLVSILDEHANELYMERCVLYSHIGLHIQSMELLVANVTDYKSLLWYCGHGAPVGPDDNIDVEPTLEENIRADFVRNSFKLLVANDTSEHRKVVTDLLGENSKSVDVTFVLKSSPEHWPISMFQDFFILHIGQLRSDTLNAGLKRSLTKQESIWVGEALKAYTL